MASYTAGAISTRFLYLHFFFGYAGTVISLEIRRNLAAKF